MSATAGSVLFYVGFLTLLVIAAALGALSEREKRRRRREWDPGKQVDQAPAHGKEQMIRRWLGSRWFALVVLYGTPAAFAVLIVQVSLFDGRRPSMTLLILFLITLTTSGAAHWHYQRHRDRPRS